jgi:hypothetical protein
MMRNRRITVVVGPVAAQLGIRSAYMKNVGNLARIAVAKAGHRLATAFGGASARH